TRVASRTSPAPASPDAAVETQEPRLERDVSGGPAPLQRPAPATQPPGTGAEGRIGRGTGVGADMESLSSGAAGSRMELIQGGGGSRLDRAGAGAEGTGGRTSTRQQPTPAAAARDTEENWVYRPDAAPPTHPSKVRFGNGLEFISDDEEFRLQFHDLTQLDF